VGQQDYTHLVQNTEECVAAGGDHDDDPNADDNEESDDQQLPHHNMNINGQMVVNHH